jgi:hypothetical protein
MCVPIYIKSKVQKDDVFCLKSKEMMDAVDSCIANFKGNPDQTYQSLHLERADKFEMRVAFYGGHPNAYVYVSADDKFQPLDSQAFDVSHGCGDLHEHVAKVLAAHKQ